MTTSTSRFTSSKLKLERAQSHIEALEKSISEYFRGTWYDSSLYTDANGQHHFDVVIRGKPKDIEVIVGDAIHNMRAALDVLAVQLVAASGASTKDVSFPFCKDTASLEETMKRKGFHKSPAAIQDRIRALKPYKDGNAALRALHDLDIQDKHRDVIGFLCNVTSPELRVAIDESGAPKGFREGKLEFEIDPNQQPTVVFTLPDYLAGKSIAPTLRELLKLVSDVVDSFE